MTLQIGHTASTRRWTHKGDTIMKWEYNEPHTTNLHNTVEYNDSNRRHEYSQRLFVLDLYSYMFLSHIN